MVESYYITWRESTAMGLLVAKKAINGSSAGGRRPVQFTKKIYKSIVERVKVIIYRGRVHTMVNFMFLYR